MKLTHGWILMGCLACMISLGCSDDDKSRTVLDTEKWVGGACTCEGDGCEILGIPMPVPAEGTTANLIGCDNLPDIDGSAKVCLRTIDEVLKDIAPPVYFPAGYCAISAVGCTPADPKGESTCETIRYGNVDKLTKCPAGTTLLEGVFDYKILGNDLVITNKTCVKNCNTDADCNVAGEVTCIDDDGAHYCYNEKNFKFMNRGHSTKEF